jgi:hypothetical protein
MDDSEALERVAKMKADKEAAKAKRDADRKEFMRPDPPLSEVLRQSRARKNYMKAKQFELSVPGTPEWELPKRAASRHTQFETNYRQWEQAEAILMAAFRHGDPDLIKEHRKEADERLKNCVFAAYTVGQMFNQFIEGAQRRAGSDG